jgi:uncharacterized protein YbaA (DUF1428 family)
MFQKWGGSIAYRSAAWQKMAGQPMPFDVTRMLYGGFSAIVDL